jgi:hypothetical protein
MFSKFGVESGVYIMEAGSASTQGVLSTKDVMNGSQVYMSVKSRYIDVPISLIYRHPLSEDVRIVCNVGCYIAFGQGGISEINHSKGGFSQSAFDDFNGKDDPNFNDFTIKGGNKQDFGIAAGIGVDILSHFSISANYNLGLVNVYDQYPITQDKNIKNRIFWIALGYNFNL